MSWDRERWKWWNFFKKWMEIFVLFLKLKLISTSERCECGIIRERFDQNNITKNLWLSRNSGNSNQIWNFIGLAQVLKIKASKSDRYARNGRTFSINETKKYMLWLGMQFTLIISINHAHTSMRTSHNATYDLVAIDKLSFAIIADPYPISLQYFLNF